MKNLNGRVAVVTGAGSGIGRATALALAAEGARVAATDLNEALAAETAASIRRTGGEARAFPLDVSEPARIAETAVAVISELGVPAVLVNNAGIAVGGTFLDLSAESWQRILAVNLMGVVHCCRTFLPAMVEAGAPAHVVNVSSMLGYTPMRGLSAYCATKYGVIGFSECLRAELSEHGIGVSVVCPGMVRTNIVQAARLESRGGDLEPRRAAVEALYARRNYPPERVARAVLRAIRRNPSLQPVTPEAWLAWYAKRWTPGIVGWLAARARG
jgi:NAD(P)-dependent dehydrogenase (short-subunit alcohol dehydrogenase family)